MNLDFKKFSLLSAVGAGLVYTACTIFVALWPNFSTKLMGWLFHLTNPASVFGQARVTLTGYLGALIEVIVYFYIIALIFAWIFNQSVKTK